MAETRRQNTVWLIGSMINKIDGNQLPLLGKVLSRLFYALKKEKQTLSEAASVTTYELLILWSKASIPTTQK